MSYSCTDFTDAILQELNEEIDREYDPDDPADQMEAAVKAIRRLRGQGTAYIHSYDFDISFSVHTNEENSDRVGPEELRVACIRRVREMTADEIRMACSKYTSYRED